VGKKVWAEKGVVPHLKRRIFTAFEGGGALIDMKVGGQLTWKEKGGARLCRTVEKRRRIDRIKKKVGGGGNI